MELHRRLYQNKIEAGLEEKEEDRIAARIARVQQQRNKGIEILFREGCLTPYKISEILGIHPDIVKARVAAIEREQEERNDLQVMRGPSQGGYVGILQP